MQDLDSASEIVSHASLYLERSIENLLADDPDDVSDNALKESFSDQSDVLNESKNQDKKQASVVSEIGTKHDKSNAKSKNLHEKPSVYMQW